MLAQIIVTLPIIIGMKFVDSAPIDMRMGCSASSTAVTMPKWIGEMLTDNSDTAADQAIGLYSLYRNTEFFANQTLYKSEVYTPCTNASVRNMYMVTYACVNIHMFYRYYTVLLREGKCLYGDSVHTQLFYGYYIQSNLLSAHQLL